MDFEPRVQIGATAGEHNLRKQRQVVSTMSTTAFGHMSGPGSQRVQKCSGFGPIRRRKNGLKVFEPRFQIGAKAGIVP